MIELCGAYTALITPFTEDGRDVDVARLARNIGAQSVAGIRGVVPCGTTGETPTLSEAEYRLVIERTIGAARPLGMITIAGAGSNSTAHAVSQHRFVHDAGADAALHVTPYYNRPSAEGLYRHFMAIADACPLPIVLYNIPGRTGSNVLPETLARMTEEDIIFGVKESSGDIKQIQQLCQLTGDSLKVFSGDDWMTLALVGVGGTGVISVASNVVPGPMRKYMDALQARDFVEGRRLLKDLLPLFDGLFTEPNPQPVKGAASLLGLMDANFRLPMVPPSESTMHLMKELLAPFSGK